MDCIWQWLAKNESNLRQKNDTAAALFAQMKVLDKYSSQFKGELNECLVERSAKIQKTDNDYAIFNFDSNIREHIARLWQG